MNKISPFLTITNKANNVAELDIYGDIGYNYWADTYEAYKANTIETKKAELNAIKSINAKELNIKISSLGGDVIHALAIYSEIRNLGIKVNTIYVGANASASTIIGSAANIENISMDKSGLFLVHKPMAGIFGNSNDAQQRIEVLNKWQISIEQTYLDLGVSQKDLNILMEKNGGHGEWLTFEEAKYYGFVSKPYESTPIQNTKNDFLTRGWDLPINYKNNNMQNEEKKTLFQEFKVWFKGEQENENEKQRITNLESEVSAKDAEIETLKQQVADKDAEIEALKAGNNEETSEVEVVEDETTEAIVNKAVKEALKSVIEPLEQIRNSSNPESIEKMPVWKRELEKNKFLNKIK